MELEPDINQRVLKLRDVALGSTRNVAVNSALATASYDCAVDSLLALHNECSQSSLAKDKHVTRFLSKYGDTVKSLQELRLSADDFEVKTVIGRGHFGEVQVVHEKSTGDVYAMKVMDKAHILQQADAAFFSEERDIMAWTTSPWLTCLHYAFQDKKCLYLVMDFHPGGDLLTVMERQEGGMEEDQARFYLAEIAAGLQDLHILGFVHRDVKPENVLITRSGHIKLVDFGSAARLGPKGKVVESRLPVGTPEYIAPEVLTTLDSSADYGVCCDWWSLGIIAYELLYDVTPFEGDSTAKTYSNIMNYKKSLEFPEGVEVSGGAKDLIRCLLTEASSRMEYKAITEHTFFTVSKWNSLTDAIPPYIPMVEGPDDTSNFEVFERKKDDRYSRLPSNTRGAFSGKSLPFVGFTFTRFDECSSTHLEGEGTDSRVASSMTLTEPDPSSAHTVRELRKTKEALEEAANRNASLERECVIYQSQLNDFHRKLEIEKSDNRISDSKALQLLEEVKAQSRIAQQLRETAAKTTAEELTVVVNQLEQDRMVASKRCKRLQGDLNKTQQERDAAVKKATDLKAKLSEMKGAGRRDVTGLQVKLAKVTRDSLAKVAGLQDRLTEAHEKHVKASQRLKELEGERKRTVYAQQQAELSDSINVQDANTRLRRQLEETQAARDKALRDVSGLKDQINVLRDERDSGNAQQTELGQLVKDLETKLDEARKKTQQLEVGGVQLKQELQGAKLELQEVCRGRDQEQANVRRMKEELRTKTQQIQRQDEAVVRLNSTREYLQGKISELERLREAAKGSQVDDRYNALEKKLSAAEREKQALLGNLSSLRSQLAASQESLKQAQWEREGGERQRKEAESRWRGEVKSLQSKLSEARDSTISQGERLVDVWRTKREVDRDNSTLKSSLSKAEGRVKDLEKQVSQYSEELNSLTGVKEKLTTLEEEIKSLMKLNQEMRHQVDSAQEVKEELKSVRKAAEADLRHTREEIEAHELSVALLQRNSKSLEEELAEAKAAAEEARQQEEQWSSIRVTLQGDLETAESRLDDAFASVEREKAARAVVEQKLAQAASNLEETASARSTELVSLQDQLGAQRQLASKYSGRVSELEKDIKLKQLTLEEVQKELDTEKTVSSKLYDDLHSLGREHGKLKAAHLKVLKEFEQRETQLAQAATAKELAVEAQRSAEEAHRLHELRLTSTVAQQSKLIDYLQNASPSRKGLKLKKGFKLSRKSRDPAKEMAEWTKIKGLVERPKGSRGIVAETSTPGVALHRVSSSISHLSSASSLDESSRSGTQHILSGESSLSCVIPDTSSPLVPESHLEFPHVTQYFSLAPIVDEPGVSLSNPAATDAGASSLRTALELKECSIAVQKQSVHTDAKTPTLSMAGRKRTNEARSSGQREGGEAGPGGITIEHNIPHNFLLKSAPLHKKYSCGGCKGSIKHLTKLVRCSHCNMTCHPTCIDSLPNNCGLPSQLADFPFSQQPSAKKPRKERGKGAGSQEEDVDAPTSSSKSQAKKRGRKGAGKKTPTKATALKAAPASTSVRQTRSKVQEPECHTLTKLSPVKPQRGLETPTAAKEKAKRSHKASPKVAAAALPPLEENVMKEIQGIEGVIRTEKVWIPRGEIQSEGWLVLTNNSLSFYDRNPARVQRKPLTTFSFDSSVLVVLGSVDSTLLHVPYSPRSRQVSLAFGILQHSSSGAEKTIFIASSLQSKIEWVETLQTVISKCSQTKTPPESRGRALKAVSVVPLSIKSPRRTSRELELSVTSSMMDTSTTSSVI